MYHATYAWVPSSCRWKCTQTFSRNEHNKTEQILCSIKMDTLEIRYENMLNKNYIEILNELVQSRSIASVLHPDVSSPLWYPFKIYTSFSVCCRVIKMRPSDTLNKMLPCVFSFIALLTSHIILYYQRNFYFWTKIFAWPVFVCVRVVAHVVRLTKSCPSEAGGRDYSAGWLISPMRLCISVVIDTETRSYRNCIVVCLENVLRKVWYSCSYRHRCHLFRLALLVAVVFVIDSIVSCASMCDTIICSPSHVCEICARLCVEYVYDIVFDNDIDRQPCRL